MSTPCSACPDAGDLRGGRQYLLLGMEALYQWGQPWLHSQSTDIPWALRHAYACADRRTKLSLASVEPLWAGASRDGFGEEVGLVGATGEMVGFGQVD